MEWVAYPFFRRSSQWEELGSLLHWNGTRVSWIAGGFFTTVPPGMPINYLLMPLKWKSENGSVMSDSLRPHGLYSSWNSLGQNTGVGSFYLLQGIFPTHGSNPDLPHCGWILYQLSRKGSLRTLEWVAYLFSSSFSQPRNQTGVSFIAGGFFTNWAIREPWGSAGKESACNAWDPGSIPELGKSPGEGIGYPLQYSWGFPCDSAGKEFICNVGDLGSIPVLGRSPGERKSYPLQYSGPEKSMNCIVHGVAKNWMQLRDFHFTYHCTTWEALKYAYPTLLTE